MILILEDRYNSLLLSDTKQVPVALHLTSQWRYDVRVTERLDSTDGDYFPYTLNFDSLLYPYPRVG